MGWGFVNPNYPKYNKNMDSWLMLFFFLPFHLVGAFVLASQLQGDDEEPPSSRKFILIWAFFFLGIPIFMQVIAAPKLLLITVPLTVGLPFFFFWAGDSLLAAFKQPGVTQVVGSGVLVCLLLLLLRFKFQDWAWLSEPIFLLVMGAVILKSGWSFLSGLLKWWRWWQDEADNDMDIV